MSINKLPITIKPSMLCKQAPAEGSILSGEIPLDKVLNLNHELKKRGLTPIAYQLRFYVDSNGIEVVEGVMTGEFELICQRCLQPMQYTIKAEVSVSPVSSDAQAKRLPECYEPLLMIDGEVNFAEWIAEELHLALPLVPRHEAICISHDSYIQDRTDE